jgi:hypothetical protein
MKPEISISIGAFIIIMFLSFGTLGAQTCSPYLGQVPPGNTPIKFAPVGFSSTGSAWWHGSPAFSPDGKEMYWTLQVQVNATNQRAEIWYTKCINGQWSAPARFSNVAYDENGAQFLESNDTLYFHSSRPGGFIFRTVRTLSGWMEPSPLNIPLPVNSEPGLGFSMSKNKTIYFEIWGPDYSTPSDLYRTELVDGQYNMPTTLGPGVNSANHEFGAFIDQDERFILFSSNKPGLGMSDLYMSIRNQDGTWERAFNLGARINTSNEDASPTITPDGKYFFFISWKTGDTNYSPYWVSTQFIKENFTGIGEVTTPTVGVSLNQNEPNPCNGQTRFSFELTTPAKISLKIYDQAGKEVADITNNQFYPNGKHSLNFDVSGLPGGIYTYVLKPENSAPQSKKMVVGR